MQSPSVGPTATHDATALAPVTFSSPTQVGLRTDVYGAGDRPTTGVAVLFIQFEDEQKFVFTEPLNFDVGPHQWQIKGIQVGAVGNIGSTFHLRVVQITDDELRNMVSPMFRRIGTPLAEHAVKRVNNDGCP